MKNIIYSIAIAVLMLNSCTAPPPSDPIPVHETFKLYATAIGEERTINVWLPEAYQNSEDSFGVLYMADGGTNEDFSHIANTLQELIVQKKIPAIILVGIANTERRRDLSGPTTVAKDKEIAPVVGGSIQFRAFIKDELLPEINKKYRTTPYKGLIGESLSGLFVVETLMTAPNLFDYYIAFDPSLWWNNQYLVKNANTSLAQLPTDKNIKFWFAGSSATDIAPYTKELANILKNNNYPTLQWHYADEPHEQHNSIFRATKDKAFLWTLGSKQ